VRFDALQKFANRMTKVGQKFVVSSIKDVDYAPYRCKGVSESETLYLNLGQLFVKPSKYNIIVDTLFTCVL